MGLRDSMRELSGYFKEQRKEGATRTKLVRESIKKESKKKEYHNFKKALFEKLDELFYEREYTRVVIVPTDTSLKYEHFDTLLSDPEFVYYYDGEFLRSGEFSVRRRILDL